MAKHVKKYHLSLAATEARFPDRGTISIPRVYGRWYTASYSFGAVSDSGSTKTKQR